jgi:hypothetical protein
MVTLFLRKFTHAVYELECLAKVGKRERLRDVVLFSDAQPVFCSHSAPNPWS